MKTLILPDKVLQNQVSLTPEDSHYLLAVLRMSPGDKFSIVDVSGLEYRALLVSADKKGALCQIQELLPDRKTEPAIEVELWLPLLKGEKLELVIQKAVELGVAGISLWVAERSISRPRGEDKKFSRWQLIAKNAAQQCGRTRIPLVRGYFSLDDLKLRNRAGYFAWEKQENSPLAPHLDRSKLPGDLILLTGPEGGLTSGEADLLLTKGMIAVGLGPRILRAETAAITMLACAMFALGQLE